MPIPKTSKVNHETAAFYLMSRHDCARYLICNTIGRSDGYEKATVHKSLVETFMAINYLIEEDEAWGHKRRHSSKRSFGSVRGGGIWLTGAGPYEFIHDHTQSLTSHLDKIGMPTVKEVRPDYDKLSPVFAYKFYNLALEAAVMWEKSEPL